MFYLQKVFTTQDEAVKVQVLAAEHHWKRILLVSSAFHLRRAEKVFTAKGLNIVPVGCDFQGMGMVESDRVWIPVPDLHRFWQWNLYLHEQIGWWLYSARGFF